MLTIKTMSMRKLFIILTLILFGIASLKAQENSTEKVYAPEKGDFGIGMDMSPIFRYMGNMFTNNGTNLPPSANFINLNELFILKKFLSEKAALRLLYNFDVTTSVTRYYVNDDASNDPLSNVKVVDEMFSKTRAYGLGVGFESRRGKDRIWGYFGIDALFYYSNNKYSFNYGNPMTVDNPNPSTWNFGNNIINIGGATGRILSYNNGAGISVAAVPFIGVEFFIIPKLSIGANYGFGLSYYHSFQEKYEYEIIDNGYYKRIETVRPGDSERAFSYYNPYMNFYLMFHF